MGRDILSSYVSTGVKIASWAAVSALVYRLLHADDLATVALTRATVGILAYAALGLLPALVHRLAQAQVDPLDQCRAYSNGLVAAVMAAVVGSLLSLVYAGFFPELHQVNLTPTAQTSSVRWLVATMGWGTVVRLASEPSGAVLQTQGRLTMDNLLLAAGELAWVLFSAAGIALLHNVSAIGWAYLASGFVVFFARTSGAMTRLRPQYWLASAGEIRRLIVYGMWVVAGQLADFLYAPAAYIVINAFLPVSDLTAYVPAVQIDSALLALAGAVATVILPRVAMAQAAGQTRRVRWYFVTGTAASVGLLAVLAVLTWAGSPLILRLWLGQDIPATRQILPLVLIHTVIGASSVVGRAILLGMGKARAFSLAALVAGAGNVAAAIVFVGCFGLGLCGIIYATILVVVARCAIWMPWYVLRCLRD